MAKDHGSRRQKKLAKHKAKRQEKRAILARRDSKDPTVRLARAADWPIVHTLVGEDIWEQGIGNVVLARRSPDGQIVFAAFMVDVFCLGVKNAFWDVGTPSRFSELIDHIEETQDLREVTPEFLAKLVLGAVEYAADLGFQPHADYRHAKRLLEGIDPAACPDEFEFGKDGIPFYIQGPNESLAEAKAISLRVEEQGGDFLIMLDGPRDFDPDDLEELEVMEQTPDFDDFERSPRWPKLGR